MKKSKNVFSENLRKLMFEKKVTQEILAESIGTNQQMISRWLNGGRKPSLTSLEKIAEALNVSVCRLISSEIESGNSIDKEKLVIKDQEIKLLKEKISFLEDKINFLENK